MKNRHYSLLFILATAVTPGLVGCGGSGSSIAPINNAFAGKYKSSATVNDGRTANVAMTVDPNGKATGTVTVVAPKTREFSFDVGTYMISGDVDANGNFSIIGTGTNTTESFDISGNLPTSGSGTGSMTIHAGGNQYPASITVDVTTGGSGSLTFSDATSTNADTSAFPTNPYIIISTVLGSSSIVAVPSTTDTSRSFSVALSPNATAGNSYPISSTGEVTLGYSESDKDWKGNSGSIQIVSRTANSFEVKFINVEFTARTSTSATGSFKVSGTLKK